MDKHFPRGGITSSAGLAGTPHVEHAANSTHADHTQRLTELANDVVYPLVDEALKSVSERYSGGGNEVLGGEAEALSKEADRLLESATLLAEGSVRIVAAKATGLKQRILDGVRKRPLVALGLVAAVAYKWGAGR